MQLDLHNYTANEALDFFIERYNAQITQGNHTSMEVVHGYGSQGYGGVIRSRMRAFLIAHAHLLSFIPGEQIDGNPGYTIVHPVQQLPTKAETLCEQIVSYCTVLRSEEKIMGKFRRYGESVVLQSLKKLEKEGTIVNLRKGKYKCYQAV